MANLTSPLRLVVAEASIRHLQPNAPISFEIEPGMGSVVVGRESSVGVRLLSQVVSRRHALLEHNGEEWTIRDLGSKAGTRVNLSPATQEQAQSISPGDQLFIGPIILNVRIPLDHDATFNVVLKDESMQEGASILAKDVGGTVSTIADAELGGLAQHRLAVLLKWAAKLTEAPDLTALAQAITRSAAEGTGCARALLLRVAADDQLELLAGFPAHAPRRVEMQLSRSLVALALQGKIAELQYGGYDSVGEAMSIEALNIRSAICAPLAVDNKVLAVLYLDTRGSESPIKPDAASFCVALAQLGAMAIANLQRAELARQEKEMRDELVAARLAQTQLMPEAVGRVGPIQYSLEAIPGLIVAGDLFDVVALSEDCTLVLLGDVMGKGAAAGLMMATIQAFFRARSKSEMNLVECMTEANTYFYDRFNGRGFVTLWLGMFDRTNRRLTYIDAGHGDWCYLQDNASPHAVDSDGGPPLGAFAHSAYEFGQIELHGRDRIVVFSDGLVEQHNQTGQTFGETEPLKCLVGSRSASEDVNRLIVAHTDFRKETPLSDDLTIASIEWVIHE